MKTKNRPDNEQSSKPQPDPRQKRSVLWIVAIFFISGWVFFLGIIIGRGTAPALFDYNRIETEITTLAKNFTDSRKAQDDMATDSLKTPAELGFPEELKKKTEDPAKMQMPAQEKPVKPAETPKTFRQEPALAQAPQPPASKPEPQTPARPETIEPPPESIKAEAEAKIKSVYDLKAPQARETAPERAPLPAPERTPAAAPKPQPPAFDNKTAPAQPVAIHLTSLVDKKSADTLIESLRSKGISATVTPKMIQGKGIWYMVVIGKYASATEADAMLNRLKQENIDASVVKQ